MHAIILKLYVLDDMDNKIFNEIKFNDIMINGIVFDPII